jgi:hypothetical protein
MTIYNSDQYAVNAPVAVHGERNAVQVARFTVTLAAAPATTDTINLGYMPPNARIIDGYALPSDMDTNGSPTLTLNIGDSGSAARLFSALAAGVAAAVTRLTATTAIGYKFTAKTLLVCVPQANAATGAAGTLEVVIIYYLDE